MIKKKVKVRHKLKADKEGREMERENPAVKEMREDQEERGR